MLTGPGGRTGLRSACVACGTRGNPAWRPRRLAWALALAVALAAMFLLSLSQSLTTALSSDEASNILQAQAMLYGNPLLRGWWTSDVSFYTTELPEYALVVAARGVSPDVVHICGALTYTLSAVLAGRTLPPSARPLVERIARARLATAATVTTAATVALAGWLAVGVAEAGDAATWPASRMPVQNVAAWLVAHHQRDGLAAYWQGPETTVASGGRVLVAPVTASAAAADHWEASSAWYQPSRYRATFVIAELRPDDPRDSLTVVRVRARFGRPAAEYQVGGDIVMVYGYNLLSRLRGRTFPGPS
jgi:hypothetical protein